MLIILLFLRFRREKNNQHSYSLLDLCLKNVLYCLFDCINLYCFKNIFFYIEKKERDRGEFISKYLKQ